MKRNTTLLTVTAVTALALGLPLAANAAPGDTTPAPAPGQAAAGQTPGLSANEQAQQQSTMKDLTGDTITRFERTYKGLPVVHGRFSVVQTPGESLGAGQVENKTPVELDSTAPRLTATQALAKVPMTAVLKGDTLTKQTKTLVVYLDKAGGSHLAYDVYTEGSGTNTLDVKKHVYVDADTGAILGTTSDVKGGHGDGIYDKNVSFGTKQTSQGYTFGDSHGNTTNDLKSGETGPGTPIYDSDDVWGGSNKVQAEGVDAQKGVELTYNFYQDTYGRAGIWNNGKGAVARIRWKNCFTNAQWDGTYMSIGEGDGCTNPLTELDVMAHEMTHGVTENTSNLDYELESGGLNEAMSDIFGTMTEWYANLPGDTPDYYLGELINLTGDGTPLRFMDKPSKDYMSYDCWDPAFAQKAANGVDDKVDVHNSSGPMNHAFYLLSEGSGTKTVNGITYSSPTCNGGTVQGITRDKAAKIIYTALTSPTTPQNSTYKQFRDEMIKAAKSLYGGSSQECKSTVDTMNAIKVGVGSQSCDGGPTGPTSTSTTSTTTSTTSTSQNPGGGVTPLTNGVGVLASGAAGSEAFYSITVPAGATNLVMSTSRGTGDVDLYTKYGAKPSDYGYDCRPYQTGNNETCTVAAPQAGTYYLRLKGYAAYSGVTVTASYTGNGGPTTSTSTTTWTTPTSTSTSPTPTSTSNGGWLSKGVPVSVSGSAGSDTYCMISVPMTAMNLKISTSGGTGDVDLSAKWLSKPTDTSYDCRPAQSGNNETCSITYPYSGTYYVRLNGKQDYSGVTLVASWS